MAFGATRAPPVPSWVFFFDLLPPLLYCGEKDGLVVYIEKGCNEGLLAPLGKNCVKGTF
jgi:hypothetical protein